MVIRDWHPTQELPAVQHHFNRFSVDPPPKVLVTTDLLEPSKEPVVTTEESAVRRSEVRHGAVFVRCHNGASNHQCFVKLR
jgi:hypothetical protein